MPPGEKSLQEDNDPGDALSPRRTRLSLSVTSPESIALRIKLASQQSSPIGSESPSLPTEPTDKSAPSTAGGSVAESAVGSIDGSVASAASAATSMTRQRQLLFGESGDEGCATPLDSYEPYVHFPTPHSPAADDAPAADDDAFPMPPVGLPIYCSHSRGW